MDFKVDLEWWGQHYKLIKNKKDRTTWKNQFIASIKAAESKTIKINSIDFDKTRNSQERMFADKDLIFIWFVNNFSRFD